MNPGDGTLRRRVKFQIVKLARGRSAVNRHLPLFAVIDSHPNS